MSVLWGVLSPPTLSPIIVHLDSFLECSIQAISWSGTGMHLDSYLSISRSGTCTICFHILLLSKWRPLLPLPPSFLPAPVGGGEHPSETNLAFCIESLSRRGYSQTHSFSPITIKAGYRSKVGMELYCSRPCAASATSVGKGGRVFGLFGVGACHAILVCVRCEPCCWSTAPGSSPGASRSITFDPVLVHVRFRKPNGFLTADRTGRTELRSARVNPIPPAPQTGVWTCPAATFVIRAAMTFGAISGSARPRPARPRVHGTPGHAPHQASHHATPHHALRSQTGHVPWLAMRCWWHRACLV